MPWIYDPEFLSCSPIDPLFRSQFSFPRGQRRRDTCRVISILSVHLRLQVGILNFYRRRTLDELV